MTSASTMRGIPPHAISSRENEMPWPMPVVKPLDQGSETDTGDY